jgi:HEAT repeat protein
VLVRTAKSGEPIALRCEAVKTLGIAGDAENIAALGTIARDTSAPREVRFAVIEAYLIAHRPNEMIGIATSDPDPRVRARAIESLGAMGAHASLRQLWGTEKDPALRGKLLEAFGVAGDVDTLAKAARDSSEPRLRRKAIEGLAIVHGPAAQRELRRMYAEFTDPQDKRKVVEALMVQGDAKVLVEMFRAEKDPEMKRVILQQLSVMNDPEVTRIIMEILGDKP